ncbi:MAG: hypothetical protein Q4G28_07510 [Neisseria sp.]|nr:hypothetical protein [Neisseria sp.]
MAGLLEQLLDAKRLLRLEFVTAQGFGARIFADYIDPEAFRHAINLAWADCSTDIILHHAEFGAEERLSVFQDTDSA